jgi:DNA-binding CsgD family transcriptional regulator
MHLTKTEKKIIKKMLLPTKNIAKDLVIEKSTVKTHIWNILKKLKSKSRGIGIIKALRLKLLKLEEVDIGFWDENGIYIEDIQEIDLLKEAGQNET